MGEGGLLQDHFFLVVFSLVYLLFVIMAPSLSTARRYSSPHITNSLAIYAIINRYKVSVYSGSIIYCTRW